jgi:hypothetical protein
VQEEARNSARLLLQAVLAPVAAQPMNAGNHVKAPREK